MAAAAVRDLRGVAVQGALVILCSVVRVNDLIDYGFELGYSTTPGFELPLYLLLCCA